MDRKVRGLTLIELLVVIAIIAVLVVAGTLWIGRDVERTNLRRSVDQIVGTLELVKRYSSTRPQLHGMQIQNNTVRIFAVNPDANNCEPGQFLEEFQISRGIEVNEVLIVFDRMGYPRNRNCALGMTSITLRGTSTNEQITICINRYGRVRVQSGGSCDAGG